MSDLPVLSVAELTQYLRELIETAFPVVAVRGEISNTSRAASGHVYFTLKDESSQVRAILWRNAASRLRFDLEDGLEVVAVGALEVYPARGSYQLITQELIPQGVGPLELAFRQLQEKLAAEGLFDPEHKQTLPPFPRRIALVTSPTGAAIRDLLQVIGRRWPAVDIVVLPVAVQGDRAAPQIVQALADVTSLVDVDVVIVGRGGGSLEDLWAFNEEAVARAIFRCPIPIISAVGHEVDVSIADLVADQRAATPTEAGELVVPDRAEIQLRLQQVEEFLRDSLQNNLEQKRTQLELLRTHRMFTHPREAIHSYIQQLDELAERMQSRARHHTHLAREQLQSFARTLEALSPLAVLQRGYSITYRTDNLQSSATLVKSLDDLQPGDQLRTDLADGQVISEVRSVTPRNSSDSLS